MTDLTDLTLHQAAASLRAGEVSSRELTEACLDRLAAVDPRLRSFLSVTADLARTAAEAADRQLAAWRRGTTTAGQSPSPLLGVPLAIKDVLCLRGTVTTAGSRILEGFVAPYSATAVERLLVAGAVILGKTNCDEFAMGSSTENSGYDVTHNPWDLARVPGGSSGGSAAAVAARLTFGALGSDTGGSIRQPAAYCGLAGLKTSYGRVSRYGLIAYGSSLDSIGPLARSVADLAALFSATAGHDPRDATSLPAPVPPVDLAAADVTGLRVGVPKEYFVAGIQPEVEAAVRAAVVRLAELGAQVVEISLPHTEYALPVYYLIAPAEASANLARFDGVRYGPGITAAEAGHNGGTSAAPLWARYEATRGTGFGPEVKRRIMLGTYALSAGYYDAYYGQAQKVRTLIRRDFDLAFQQVDVIACPVAPTTAFRIGEKTDDPLAMYLEDIFTLPASLAGICGLSVPCGFDAQGLPIGVQLLGPALGEDRLLRVGHAYEQATDWHTRRPPL
ncbi:MAG: Asp-tRNA(Asn)/Glu-tRNA(Gln) amidotransferase subunit GatA [Anaerolineales bacterium]|nr:Asp-tRNA(Asn)/Glu-tRNA(Gln) amidotransferase subunit GatA [Anaerolineales bacterium]